MSSFVFPNSSNQWLASLGKFAHARHSSLVSKHDARDAAWDKEDGQNQPEGRLASDPLKEKANHKHGNAGDGCDQWKGIDDLAPKK